jgi:GntR family transcriptional regulator
MTLAPLHPKSRAAVLDRSGRGPLYLYEQIADDLAARIRAGEFPHGRLPGERVLAAEYDVAYLTIRHATRLLRDRGQITISHGRPSRALPPPDSGRTR